VTQPLVLLDHFDELGEHCPALVHLEALHRVSIECKQPGDPGAVLSRPILDEIHRKDLFQFIVVETDPGIRIIAEG
jgi:hypothetical protein